MVIANPRVHIICGVCGSRDEFEFKLDPEGNCDENGDEYMSVDIYCGNCSTLTGLDELIPDRGERLYFQNKE